MDGLITTIGGGPDLYEVDRSAWGLASNERVLNHNCSTSAAREHLAYCLGFRAPITDYVLSQFGVGTGTTVPNVEDTGLEAPIEFSPGVTLKAIDGITFPAPFVLLVSCTLGINDANGYLITELGLFAGNGRLLARGLMPAGIAKDSSAARPILWRVRV